MGYCKIDDCEMDHCANCGGHTVGNQFRAGLCDFCYDMDEQEYERQRFRGDDVCESIYLRLE